MRTVLWKGMSSAPAASMSASSAYAEKDKGKTCFGGHEGVDGEWVRCGRPPAFGEELSQACLDERKKKSAEAWCEHGKGIMCYASRSSKLDLVEALLWSLLVDPRGIIGRIREVCDA
jgi:hypothetical protein